MKNLKQLQKQKQTSQEIAGEWKVRWVSPYFMLWAKPENRVKIQQE